jgi:hypothetical protein
VPASLMALARLPARRKLPQWVSPLSAGGYAGAPSWGVEEGVVRLPPNI